MGRFAAGVTVVTLPEPYHGITVNSFASVSLEPPLVLVCLDHDTESHRRLGRGDAGYCVNILTRDQQDLGEHFAAMTELEPDPFEAEPIRTDVTGAPIFESALAYLDCSLHESVPAGDHTIYVAEVEGLDVLHPEAEPLTYYDGEWGTIRAD